MSDRRCLSISQARVVAAVAETGSLGRAADILHCSHSVVSRTVAAAERLVGKTLFERSWSNTTPTGFGRMAIPRCQRALECLRSLEDLVASHVGSRQNLLVFLKWHHLEAIAAIVSHGSATRAAAYLATTQPAVSRAVANFSRYAKVTLFERTRSGLAPTPLARALSELYGDLASELDISSISAPCLPARKSDRLSIGISTFGGQHLISKAISELMTRHDVSRLSSVHGNYDVLCRALRHGEIDCIVGALRAPTLNPDFRELYLYSEEFHLFADKNGVRQRDYDDIETLRNNTWLVGPEGTPARSTFNAFFKGQGLRTPEKVFEISSFVDAQSLLQTSDSIGLMCYSRHDLKTLPSNLKQLDFELPMADVSIGLTLDKGRRSSDVLDNFMKSMMAVSQSEMAIDPQRTARV